MNLAIEGLLSVYQFSTLPAQQTAAPLPWVVALGLVGALLFTAVFNFLVRETLILFHIQVRPAVPVTGTHEPGLQRWAWGFSALAGLVGAVLVIIILNAASSNPTAQIGTQLASPPQVLMMGITTLTACLTAGMLSFCYLLLKHRAGSSMSRLYYLTVTLAWVVLMIGLYFTSWLQVS